jgi:MFS family permease
MPVADTTRTTGQPAAVQPGTAAWSDLLRGANGVLALALTGGVALYAVNVHVVSTVLPSVVQDIGGLDFYAWNTTLFEVASIIGAALSVRVLEALGPRGAYLAALVIFAVGSAMCAAAPACPGCWPGAACKDSAAVR